MASYIHLRVCAIYALHNLFVFLFFVCALTHALISRTTQHLGGYKQQDGEWESARQREAGGERMTMKQSLTPPEHLLPLSHPQSRCQITALKWKQTCVFSFFLHLISHSLAHSLSRCCCCISVC